MPSCWPASAIPGLAALKEISPVPVVGMADASILQACTLGGRFSIVTGGERWQSMLEEFVAGMGLASRLASVRTVAPTGADIARNPKAAMALLAKGCQACVKEDRADVVILGGAGLAGLAAKLEGKVEVPLLDGVACAISTAESLAAQKPAKARTGRLSQAGAGRQRRPIDRRLPGCSELTGWPRQISGTGRCSRDGCAPSDRRRACEAPA